MWGFGFGTATEELPAFKEYFICLARKNWIFRMATCLKQVTNGGTKYYDI